MPLDRLPSELLVMIMEHLGESFFENPEKRIWWRWDILARRFAPTYIRVEPKDWGTVRSPADNEWNTVIRKFEKYGHRVTTISITFLSKDKPDKHSNKVKKKHADRVNNRLQQVTEMIAGCKKLKAFSVDIGPPAYNHIHLPLLDSTVFRNLLETLHNSGQITDLSLNIRNPLSGNRNIWPVINKLVASGTLTDCLVSPYAICLDTLGIAGDDHGDGDEAELPLELPEPGGLSPLLLGSAREDSDWCFVDLVKVLRRRALEPRHMRMDYLEEWFVEYYDRHDSRCQGYCEVQRRFYDGGEWQ